MGFFKNLFEKKTCDLCGGEIGMLGNRKLEDGNCCKDCAKKLSPWFEERKHSTVEQIRAQLESRERNRQAVAAFHVTRHYGVSMMVLMDQEARKFMVTDADGDRLEEKNPDVLDFSQVTACDLHIQEAKNEVYHQVRDEEGKLKNESFSPRRYRYSYNFQMKIRVNHPYIEEMNFSLSGGYFKVAAQRRTTAASFLFGGQEETYGPDGSSSAPPTQADLQENSDYVRYERWAREIREILLSSEPVKKASPLNSLLKDYKTVEQEYETAKTAGDPGRVYALRDRQKQVKEKLYDAYLEEIGRPAPDGSIFEVLLAQLQAVDRQPRENADRSLLADNAKEVIMEKLLEARMKDPEGFEKAGVMEALAGGTPNAAPAAPGKTVTCPWCGSQVEPGKFCGNCGGKLDP